MNANSPEKRGLLQLQAEQQTYEIGNVRIGGQPGVQPAVLIGTIFYHGQDFIIDEERGEFDRDRAEAVIRAQADFSARTGNPCMLDVVGATPEAIQKHLEFVAGVTDGPFLIDGTTTEVRLAGLDYVAKAGLADRAVYNSIQPEIDDTELQAIADAGVTAALILTYYLLDFTAEGRVECVRQLMPRAQAAGINKLIVDTCVLDLATFGQACSAMFDIKDQMGLPTGGGVHNAVAMWKGLKTKMGKQAKKPCIATASACAVACGADFALYGPVEDAQYVFPAVAMMDTALSQLAIERGMTPVKPHPRYLVG